MTRPRNARIARAQALRAEIRELLEQHPPLAPPLTAKHLQPLLTRCVELRTIRWHVQQLRAELPPRQFPT